MARPIKEGLDYFPIDVDMDYDDKVQVIEGLYGSAGFATIIKVLMKIYSNGYFYQFGEQEQILLAKRIGIEANVVNNIIKDCIKYGLFNEKLFNEFELLTSRGIQLRYFNAVGKRKKGYVFEEYLLIPPTEMLEYCPYMTLKTVVQGKTTQSDGVIHGKTTQDDGVIQESSTQSKGKESKGNKRKVDDSKNNNEVNNNHKSNPYTFYEQNGFGTIAPIVRDKIEAISKDFVNIGSTAEEADDLIIRAMDMAVVRNARNWAYAEKILINWNNKGIKTVADVDASEKEFQNSKNNSEKKGIYGQEFKRTPEDDERIKYLLGGEELSQEYIDSLI